MFFLLDNLLNLTMLMHGFIQFCGMVGGGGGGGGGGRRAGSTGIMYTISIAMGKDPGYSNETL